MAFPKALLWVRAFILKSRWVGCIGFFQYVQPPRLADVRAVMFVCLLCGAQTVAIDLSPYQGSCTGQTQTLLKHFQGPF